MPTQTKHQPGDPFRFPAAVYNELLDALAYVRQLRAGQAGPPTATIAPGPARVLNATGADVDRYAILGIDGSEWDPTASAPELASFQRQPLLTGAAPSLDYAAHADGRFCITLDPIPDGKIGRCALAGLIPVQIDLAATWHTRADLIAADTAKLRSFPGGPARILAIDRATTGTRWGLVLLGLAPETEYDATLDGELEAGSSTTATIAQVSGGAWEDTAYSATVYAPRILESGTIPAGTKITARWHAQAQRLQLASYAC
jgi:hypothetical protein